MPWKTSDFNVPRPVEQATAAPGEERLLGVWQPPRKCQFWRDVQFDTNRYGLFTVREQCILDAGHDGDHQSK